eukprot:m.261047 g.261047  ORF g.261047 m.261047 type:complete len:312 (-) comp41172_c0_seq1:53-988(-)
MLLNQQVQQSFQLAKVEEQNTGVIHSIDYSDDGKMMVTSSVDDSINLYDCVEGTHTRTLHSKKYGAGLIRFTHGGQTVLHSSLKENDTIRYLSLHDNKYLRYFTGHKDKVTSLDISPINDMFLSASLDMSVRLWDVRSTNCSGVVQASDVTAAAYDPKGLVFSIGIGSDVKLYDSRNYDKGPFATFSIERRGNDTGAITNLEFSGDGTHILARTSDNMVYVLDAFQDATKACHGHEKNVDVMTACFSPCGLHLFGGLKNGTVKVWETETGADVATLKGHNESITALKFNPKLMLLATGSTELGMWIPSITE